MQHILRGFLGNAVVKNLPANAGDAGSIPELGGSPGEGKGAIHSSILAWRIPWTEELSWLQSIGSQRVRTERLHAHTRLIFTTIRED